MSDLDKVELVTGAIRRYLAGNPKAADTLDGIHRWWIDWGDEEESREATERALARLVEQGVMESVEIANRRVFHARRSD